MGVEPAATRPAKLRATHPAKPSATLRRTPAATRPAKRHGPVRPDGVQPACSWAGKHPPPRATGSLRPPPAASGGAGVSYPSAYTETTPRHDAGNDRATATEPPASTIGPTRRLCEEQFHGAGKIPFHALPWRSGLVRVQASEQPPGTGTGCTTPAVQAAVCRSALWPSALWPAAVMSEEHDRALSPARVPLVKFERGGELCWEGERGYERGPAAGRRAADTGGLHDGQHLYAVVKRRRREADGTWWYDLQIHLPATPRGTAG